MANPFTIKPNGGDAPKRNHFDLSHFNNFSMSFFKLYPNLLLETVPGDSFHIKAATGIQAMPMVFPVQTQMRYHQYFFKVPMRILWKDFKDYYGNTKQGLVMPYISGKDNNFFATSSLSDYLGVPSTLATEVTKRYYTGFKAYTESEMMQAAYVSVPRSELSRARIANGDIPLQSEVTLPAWANAQERLAISYNYNGDVSASIGQEFQNIVTSVQTPAQNPNNPCVYSDLPVPELANGSVQFSLMPATLITGGSITCVVYRVPKVTMKHTYGTIYESKARMYAVLTPTLTNGKITVTLPNNIVTEINTRRDLFNYYLVWVSNQYLTASNLKNASNEYKTLGAGCFYNTSDIEVNAAPSTPFTGNDPECRINALPYRAYEAIYNSFFRDVQVDPFKINNVVEYNKYIPTEAGGADIYNYQLHYRTWEKDFLTTCMTSPQQGIAPLVGVTVNNSDLQAKFQFDSGEATVNLDDNGTLTGISYTTPDLPVGNRVALIDAISSGISINDFRNVNALQRWLEKNIRRGYRYKDVIESHFGKSPRYDELNMPEFVGGFSRTINVQNAVDMAGVNNPLGTSAGRADLMGSSDHSVNIYTDEPCYIVGIMCITPTPVYSQYLPKLFTKHKLFDHYFPEFGHIGYQPVTYENVTPIQSYQEGKPLTDVFGYQRAWWEYLSHPDTVHGQMRSSMSNYLISRVFTSSPELSADFVNGRPEDVNDVFAVVDDNDDKFVGQVYFDIDAERPIPKLGIPRLE